MEHVLTFEQLPQAVIMLTKEVGELKRLLIEKQVQTPTEQLEIWFDLNDLIQYDPEKRTKPTWYSKISRNEVPHYKQGKKIYFLKSEIDEWLKQGKCKSNAEIEQEAKAYFKKKGGNNE
jgi:excisionase family DNA binding protein